MKERSKKKSRRGGDHETSRPKVGGLTPHPHMSHSPHFDWLYQCMAAHRDPADIKYSRVYDMRHLLWMREANREAPRAFVNGTFLVIQTGPREQDMVGLDMRDVLHLSQCLTNTQKFRGRTVPTMHRRYRGVEPNSSMPTADAHRRMRSMERPPRDAQNAPPTRDAQNAPPPRVQELESDSDSDSDDTKSGEKN